MRRPEKSGVSTQSAIVWQDKTEFLRGLAGTKPPMLAKAMNGCHPLDSKHRTLSLSTRLQPLNLLELALGAI